MDSKYLYKTDYFERPWTWVRRVLVILVLCLGTLILEIPWLIKLPLFILIVFYWTVKPKEDILLNREELIIIRRSKIKLFTKTYVYQLSSITSFRIRGVHNTKWEIIDFLNGGTNMGGVSNLIEISFKDGSSTSLNLRIDKSELDQVRKMIYNFKARMRPTNS